MKHTDYAFIAENISNISRIIVRVYRNKKLEVLFNTSSFPVDPASPYLAELLKNDQNVSYYVTPLYHFYGVIRCDSHTLILGPCYQNHASRAQIRDYMYSLGLKENYVQSFNKLLNSITPMPLEMFLHLLCLIYYYVSGKKLNVTELLLYDNSSQAECQNIRAKQTFSPSPAIESVSGQMHDTYLYEKQMLSLVTSGSVDDLEKLFSSTSPGQSGKMADGYLRQLKNIFISSVTLVSRAAIEGGLPEQNAFALSDRYVQHCEKYNDASQILNLQHHMVLDYASLVREITNGTNSSAFLRSIITYVQEHITETITVNALAKDLCLSPNYLSFKFRQESGMTFSQFVTQQKIKKAKEYLKNTNRSILEISTLLGFSSQGYFQNVFKKVTGMTPREFLEK